MENYIILKGKTIMINDLIEGKSLNLAKIFPNVLSGKFVPLRRVNPVKDEFQETKEKILELSKECKLCFKKCGTNRLKEYNGCGPPINKAYIFDWGPCFSPVYDKTYAIYFAFCNLKCKNCFYRKYWEGKDLSELKEFVPEYFVEEIRDKWEKKEIYSLLFTGGNPDQSIYKIIELLEIIPKELPVVFETNCTMEMQLYEKIKNFIDIFIISNKFSKEYGINLDIFQKDKYLVIDNDYIFDYNNSMTKEEFLDFIEENKQKLMHYAIMLTKNEHNAKDLLQEAITHLLEKNIYKKIKKNQNPYAYVTKTMLNIFLNSVKKQKVNINSKNNKSVNKQKINISSENDKEVKIEIVPFDENIENPLCYSEDIILDEEKLEEEADEIVKKLINRHRSYSPNHWIAYVERIQDNTDYEILSQKYGLRNATLRQMQSRITNDLEEMLREIMNINSYNEEEMKKIISFIFEKLKILSKEANEIAKKLNNLHKSYSRNYWKAFSDWMQNDVDYKTLIKEYEISSKDLREMEPTKNDLDTMLDEIKSKNVYNNDEIEIIRNLIFEKLKMEEKNEKCD